MVRSDLEFLVWSTDQVYIVATLGQLLLLLLLVIVVTVKQLIHLL